MTAMKPLILALALTSSTAMAADADLLRCLAVTDGPTRLTCYDGLATALRDAKAQPSPTPVAAAGTTAAATTAQNFGLPTRAAAPTSAPNTLESRIDGPLAGWQRDSNIRLVNGQVWQIVGDPASFAPLVSPKVSISPGMFGSYFMEVEGISIQVRVKRIQ